jgi:hypothetical protein
MSEDQTMLREIETLRKPLARPTTAFASIYGDEVSPFGACVALAAKEEDEDFDDDDFDDGFDDDFEEDFDDDFEEEDDFDDDDEDEDEEEDEEDFEE